MIVIYTAPGCSSCRKAKKWLKDNNLPFIEKNIFKVLLNENEIKYLISRTGENGTEEIISKKSKVFKEGKYNLDDMTISELCTFVKNNPSILKRPIILDEKNMLVGYDSEEIDSFAPLELKKNCKCDPKCPHYSCCGDDDD